MADPYLRAAARGYVSVTNAERDLHEAVSAASRQYLQHVERAVLDHDTRATLTAAAEPDPDLWPPRRIWERLVEELILPAFTRVWRRAFRRWLSRDQRQTLHDDTDHIREHLADATQRLTNSTWPDDVYEAVREQIRRAYEDAEPVREIRKRVRHVLGPDTWRGRADTIARTEALAALNGGAYRAGQARQDVFGEALHKQWIATPDQRVRPSHWLADGQVVSLDEPFRVGGERLQFPHDPRGSAAETINCRCTLNWLTTDEVPAARDRYERMRPHRTDIDGRPIVDTMAADTTVTAAPGRIPGQLRRYWTRGAGAAKIRWGTDGAYNRCLRNLRKHVSREQLNGLCANLEKAATGHWPAEKAVPSSAACPCDEMTSEEIEALLAALPPEAYIDELDDQDELDALPEVATADAGPGETNGESWYERVAAVVLTHPPVAWFTDPLLTGPTKIRVTDEGRVYGHIADWDTEHAALPGVTARMFADDPFDRFHRHGVRTADGARISTGPLATGGHVTTRQHVTMSDAQQHYDQPEYVAADVVVGKDQHGIWCAGSLRPGVSPAQVMMLDRYSISGDWRDRQLVAACSVSVPGFHLDDDQNVFALAADAGRGRSTLADPRPRAHIDDTGTMTALVAAGVVTDQPDRASSSDGWDLYREFQAAARTHERVRDVRRRVHQVQFGDLHSRVAATVASLTSPYTATAGSDSTTS